LKPSGPGARAAVFLDRDGTITEQCPRGEFVTRPEDLALVPGAGDALRRLARAGYALVVVSNQSGVGSGLFTAEAVDAVNARMEELLAGAGVRLDRVSYCPHAPGSGCECRKPRPGMILRAAGELGLDLPRSWLLGDAARDVEAAKAAGCRTVLVHGRSYPGEREAAEALGPEASVPDLAEAVEVVLGRGGATGPERAAEVTEHSENGATGERPL
jgi:D-glycero-D-manno-heptose 1,7-bisphosphate phosphatase